MATLFEIRILDRFFEKVLMKEILIYRIIID